MLPSSTDLTPIVSNTQDQFEVIEYQPKTWTEDDVEVAITHCGVCGSDVHTIDESAWGKGKYPLVPG